MFERDEAKRQRVLDKRGLDFRDVEELFDGRPITHALRAEIRRTASCPPPRGAASFTLWFGHGAAAINASSLSGGRTMQRSGRIVRYTAEELREMRRRGETYTDWTRAAATTPEEVEAQIASDPDEAGMVVDWDNVTTEMPRPKVDVHMRLDRDVIDWFQKAGKGYQTRINAVLRSYVEHMRAREAGGR